MSARIVSSESSSARPCSASWTACSADSSRSSMISSAGPNRSSCRHSSEPMDPPAPVTRMRLPAKCPATAATSVRTGRRPSRSLILGSRTPSMRALPVSSSVTDGTTFGDEPAPLRLGGQVPDRRAAGPRDRDDQHCGPGAGGHLGHPGPVAEDLDALNAQPPLGRVVIEDGDRPVRRVRLALQPPDQHRARLTGAEDDDVHGGRRRAAGALADGEEYVPGSEHGEQARTWCSPRPPAAPRAAR